MLFALDSVDCASFDNLATVSTQTEAVRICKKIAYGQLTLGAYVWGDSGTGKSHLLVACAKMAQQNNISVKLCIDGKLDLTSETALVVIDDIELLPIESQLALLEPLKKTLAGSDNLFVISSKSPARLLRLRPDVRSRIEELPSFRISKLNDYELENALIKYTKRFGRTLPNQVAQILVHNLARNMTELTRAIHILDAYLIKTENKISTLTVREWLNIYKRQ